MSERRSNVRPLMSAGTVQGNALEDEALVRARPERDYEVRLLAGYASLYRSQEDIDQQERHLIRTELIGLVHSLKARFDEETLMDMRGDLHARDIRILLTRPVPPAVNSPQHTRLRERADAEGFHWYQQRRNAEVRQRLDRRIERAVTEERAMIAAFLREHGVRSDLAEAVRRGVHLDDGPGGGASKVSLAG